MVSKRNIEPNEEAVEELRVEEKKNLSDSDDEDDIVKKIMNRGKDHIDNLDELAEKYGVKKPVQ